MKSVQTMMIAFAVIALLLVVGRNTGGATPAIAMDGHWAKTAAAMSSGTYHIAIVADLDKQSRVKEAKKPSFRSKLREGILKKEGGKWSVSWSEPVELESKYNEAGRGMELSELVIFNNKLYTFDDRTGLVFEITKSRKTVPRFVMMEGDGETEKGQKTEWATVKDGVLYAGSFGKEYVDEKGEVTSRNNLWVSMVSSAGVVTHADWTEKYNTIRATTNSVHPAYMIIETIVWSNVHQKWFILPRRVSTEKYDEVADEKRGSNIIVKCNPEITSCEKFTVGVITPERGFSSAKFVPGTNDQIMIALKSEENDQLGTQKTFVTVFTLKGEVLVDEQLIGDNKYEGLEFI